jgi:hypothetical protein
MDIKREDKSRRQKYRVAKKLLFQIFFCFYL